MTSRILSACSLFLAPNIFAFDGDCMNAIFQIRNDIPNEDIDVNGFNGEGLVTMLPDGNVADAADGGKTTHVAQIINTCDGGCSIRIESFTSTSCSINTIDMEFKTSDTGAQCKIVKFDIGSIDGCEYDTTTESGSVSYPTLVITKPAM